MVDKLVEYSHVRLPFKHWCHMASDVDFEELHAFARACGIPERAFERDHYDVPAERRDDLLAAGAQPVRSRELVERITAAGLRRPKHRPA